MKQQPSPPTRNSPSHSGSGGFHTISSPFAKSGFGISPNRSYTVFSLLILLIAGVLISTRFLFDPTVFSPNYPRSTTLITKKPPEFKLHCSANETTWTCRRNNYPTTASFGVNDTKHPPNNISTCPDYFRYIHEDLRPWASTGITREALERAKKTANFRLVIVSGKVYVEKFQDAFQTRDVFTIWGFLQLLRKYPGKIPDLELMFDCVDWPVVKAAEFAGVNAPSPPPLFRYCGDDQTLDIVFPDWSFWGWSEVNIKPWESLLKELIEGNKRINWLKREPFAYWKGNPFVAETRQDLMKCNVSEEHDWNARLYIQDWIKELKEGYNQSNLASQCHYRYKIYIEGSAWSVSEKYILACDSVTLLVKPHYYDFFTRGLIPARHYWPIEEHDKCRSIKFAVQWGNSHTLKSQDRGKMASKFIEQELKMDYVYDYMYHLLTQYSKLLRFEPTIPPDATEICSETMACPRSGNERKFMMESLVKHPAESGPCVMPPPYDPASFYAVVKKKESATRKIQQLARKYWSKQNQTLS